MPDNSGELLAAFGAEVASLRDSWTLWRRLFHRNEEPDAHATIAAGDRAYQITGRASQALFEYIRWHVLRGVLIDLNRLCDHTAIGGRKGLTVERMAATCSFPDHPGWDALVQSTASQAMQAVKNAGLPVLRNKVLAHLDAGAALGRWTAPTLDVEEVDLAVRWLVAFWYRISHPGTSIIHPPKELEEAPAMNAAVDRLLSLLDAGLRRDTDV